MYTIRFTDREEEMWLAHDATVNAEAASITVGDYGFQLVRKFCGGGHFSGTVFEILCGGKRKCKFCNGYEYKYTLSEIQRLLTLHVVSDLVEKTADSESEDDASVYCSKEESYGEDETIEKLAKLNKCNSENIPPQHNSSINNCNGKNTSDPDLTGSSKYFCKLVSVHQGQTLEQQINELNSINTLWASFDAAMDHTMDLVKMRFASVKMDGRPVEVIPYLIDNSLKLLTDTLLDFDPDFYPNIKSKSQMSKMPLIEEFLASPEHFRLTGYTYQFRLCGK